MHLVVFLLEHVDSKLIDEAIGRCELMPVEKRPRRPRAVLPGIREKAARYGILLPVWLPEDGRMVSNVLPDEEG